MESCIFCEIINGERPANFLMKKEHLVVFKDIHPQAPVHVLVVPKRHIRSINDLEIQDGPIVSDMIMAGKEIARQAGIAESGYKMVYNVERGGGQVIFHVHLHLIGGWGAAP